MPGGATFTQSGCIRNKCEVIQLQKPSSLVRKMLHKAVLDMQRSPNLSKEEVQWLQEFAACITAEFSVTNGMEAPAESREIEQDGLRIGDSHLIYTKLTSFHGG